MGQAERSELVLSRVLPRVCDRTISLARFSLRYFIAANFVVKSEPHELRQSMFDDVQVKESKPTESDASSEHRSVNGFDAVQAAVSAEFAANERVAQENRQTQADLEAIRF